MPGIAPSWASSRRQIRQSPKRRYTALGRPQRLQRLYRRVLYFCGRAAFAIKLFFAIYAPSVSLKGRPSSRRSSKPSSSVFALVVIATSSPRTASMSS
jgi:hypothetical protein